MLPELQSTWPSPTSAQRVPLKEPFTRGETSVMVIWPETPLAPPKAA